MRRDGPAFRRRARRDRVKHIRREETRMFGCLNGELRRRCGAGDCARSGPSTAQLWCQHGGRIAPDRARHNSGARGESDWRFSFQRRRRGRSGRSRATARELCQGAQVSGARHSAVISHPGDRLVRLAVITAVPQSGPSTAARPPPPAHSTHEQARGLCQRRCRSNSAHGSGGQIGAPPLPRPNYSKCFRKNLPVCDDLHFAIASGVPVATTSPPAWPPSGPRSIT